MNRLAFAALAVLALAAPAASAPGGLDVWMPSGRAIVADVAILQDGPLEMGFRYADGATTDLPYLPVLFGLLHPDGGLIGAATFAYHPVGTGAGAFTRLAASGLGASMQIDDAIGGGVAVGWSPFPAGEYRLVVATPPAAGDVRVWLTPPAGSTVGAPSFRDSVFARGYDAADVRAFVEVAHANGAVAWHHSSAEVALDVNEGLVGWMGHGLPRPDQVVSPSGNVHPDWDFVISQETGAWRASFPERTQVGPTCEALPSTQYCYLIYPNTFIGVDVDNWGPADPDPPR